MMMEMMETRQQQIVRQDALIRQLGARNVEEKKTRRRSNQSKSDSIKEDPKFQATVTFQEHSRSYQWRADFVVSYQWKPNCRI